MLDFGSLDAQREEYDIEEQYTAAQLGAAEQCIALYRSLGGGWESYQSLPSVHIFPSRRSLRRSTACSARVTR
jgi:hypothetical protein